MIGIIIPQEANRRGRRVAARTYRQAVSWTISRLVQRVADRTRIAYRYYTYSARGRPRAPNEERWGRPHTTRRQGWRGSSFLSRGFWKSAGQWG